MIEWFVHSAGEHRAQYYIPADWLLSSMLHYLMNLTIYIHFYKSILHQNVLWIISYIQDTVTKTIPKEKKCKKAKWLSEEALEIAEGREAKSKGEKERCTQLNAEFQRIARRVKGSS